MVNHNTQKRKEETSDLSILHRGDDDNNEGYILRGDFKKIVRCQRHSEQFFRETDCQSYERFEVIYSQRSVFYNSLQFYPTVIFSPSDRSLLPVWTLHSATSTAESFPFSPCTLHTEIHSLWWFMVPEQEIRDRSKPGMHFFGHYKTLIGQYVPT